MLLLEEAWLAHAEQLGADTRLRQARWLISALRSCRHAGQTIPGPSEPPLQQVAIGSLAYERFAAVLSLLLHSASPSEAVDMLRLCRLPTDTAILADMWSSLAETEIGASDGASGRDALVDEALKLLPKCATATVKDADVADKMSLAAAVCGALSAAELALPAAQASTAALLKLSGAAMSVSRAWNFARLGQGAAGSAF